MKTDWVTEAFREALDSVQLRRQTENQHCYTPNAIAKEQPTICSANGSEVICLAEARKRLRNAR